MDTRTDTQGLDMASNTEIEKLERRWLENPLGLTFATLAEAYRKGGDTARALEVLELGLAQHPNYVPAHIVRGRCHFDAQTDAEAEAAFQRVLELDHENVIALKGLAELSERDGRLAEAIQRLEMLVEVDRNNEEARGQLDRVRELVVAAATEAEVVASPWAPESPVEIESVPAAASAPDAVPEAETAPELAVEPPVPAAASENRSFEHLPVMDPEDLHPEEGTEFQIPNDAETLRPSNDRIADILLSSDAPILEGGLGAVEGLLGGDYASLIGFQHPTERSEPDPPAAEPAPAPEPEPVAAAEEPELVVTETMAEIFLRQGHRELALAVYQQLLLRDPSDQRIAEAVARLTPEIPLPDPEPEPDPVRVYAAALTGGTSVGDLLGTLFKAHRPSVATAVHPPAFEAPRHAAGESTRPAEDSLSLSAVFGDEAGPAGPASPAPIASGSEPSFDEFFAPATGASSDAELPKPPAEAGAISAPVPEDLEQFNAWLRGLKR